MSILEKYHLSIQISIYLKKNSPASMFSNLWSHVERLLLDLKRKTDYTTAQQVNLARGCFDHI